MSKADEPIYIEGCDLPGGCRCAEQARSEGKVGFTAHLTCVHYHAPEQKNTSVAQRLRNLADLFEQRNAVYGDDYKRHGDIMMALFPDGLTLDTALDFNRYGIFKELVTKLSRYAAQWKHGGHYDSLNDKSVYSQMLQELDADWRELYTVSETIKPKFCGVHTKPNGRVACLECDISWDNDDVVVCQKQRSIKLTEKGKIP